MTDLLQLLDRWEEQSFRLEALEWEANSRAVILCRTLKIAVQDLQSAHNITQDTRLRNFLRESLERIQGLMRNEK